MKRISVLLIAGHRSLRPAPQPSGRICSGPRRSAGSPKGPVARGPSERRGAGAPDRRCAGRSAGARRTRQPQSARQLDVADSGQRHLRARRARACRRAQEHPRREVDSVSAAGEARLNAAVNLVGVPAAWSAIGGSANAGAGVKIGIIDTGIDQNHPGFKDTGFTPPSGFPSRATPATPIIR